MKTLKTIFFLLIVQISFGQQRIIIGDTAFWYKFKTKDYNKIKAHQIIDSKNLLTIRYSTGNEIIDIWSNNKEFFEGKLILFTHSIDSKGKKKSKYYYKVEKIGQDTAKEIFQLLTNYNILKMPIQDSIKGWDSGLDGTTYFIEYKDNYTYSFKHYWTPTSFTSVPQAVSMTNFINDLDVLINLKQKMSLFFNSLPKKCSYKYGDTSVVYILKNNKKNAP